MLNQPLALTSVSKPHRDPATRDVFAQSATGPVTFFQADSVIYAQGEAAGPLYLVEFGAVRICRVTADGRRQINSFHFAGEVFGFEAGDEHSSYAESIDGTGIRVLRPSSIEQSAAKLLNIALRGFARVQEHLLLLGRMSANERMASFLLDLMERQDADDVVMLPMQRNDIADYLGMTFETVSRVLRSLRDKGLVHVPAVDRVEILDAEGLHDQIA